MNVAKMIYGIIGLIITLLILNGAISGYLVLRGTDSSSALMWVMMLFLLYDIYYIYKAYTEGNVKSSDQVQTSPGNAVNVNEVSDNAGVASQSAIGAGKTGATFVGGGKSSVGFVQNPQNAQDTIDASYAEE